MEKITFDFLANFWSLLSAIAPYILVGIFLAGAMKLWIREEWIQRQLGDKSVASSLKAILLGIPLPLCSCSVIPFATALRRSGASRASTLSFLIATPITGADSIAATYGVLGWFFTFYRVVSSVLIALLAGVLSLLFDREESSERSSLPSGPTAWSSSLAVPALSPGKVAAFSPSLTPTPDASKEKIAQDCESGSCHSSGSCDSGSPTKEIWISKLWHQSVYTVFADFAKALLVGILLGALLVTFMPSELGDYLGENLWLNYLLVVAIAAPLYICATSSIPLGVALLAAGVSPGAVFVFLTAGPASSTVTMSVIRKVLGMRSLLIYLVAVLSGTLLFGALFDLYFTEQALVLRQIAQTPEQPGFISQISAVVLLILSWKVLVPKQGGACCSA